MMLNVWPNKHKQNKNQVPVTVEISTKNRYNELSLTLISIANQTIKPKEIVIFDDNDEKEVVDLRTLPIYKNIFAMLLDKSINWKIIFGQRKGQVHNHQAALDIIKLPYIWRLDDDDVAEPDVLEKLWQHIQREDVGAVSCLIYHPGRIADKPTMASNKIEDIYLGLNIQWFRQPPAILEVDHITNTFLFKKEAVKHSYCLELSPVGHREETMFTYEMKRAGWKLLIDTSAIVWHFKSQGGIRSFTSESYWQHDEEIFTKKMKEWKITPSKYKLCVLDSGLGDHLAFKHILSELKEKYKDHRIIIANCYPEVFEDVGDIKMISIAEVCLTTNLDDYDIYKKMWDWNWTTSLVDAYRKLYCENSN